MIEWLLDRGTSHGIPHSEASLPTEHTQLPSPLSTLCCHWRSRGSRRMPIYSKAMDMKALHTCLTRAAIWHGPLPLARLLTGQARTSSHT